MIGKPSRQTGRQNKYLKENKSQKLHTFLKKKSTDRINSFKKIDSKNYDTFMRKKKSPE